jgi:type IV secretory pathway TraG/TraD family ATPase VirD4
MTLPLVLGGIGCLLVAVLTIRDTLAGGHASGQPAATRNTARRMRPRRSRLERRRARHAAQRLGVDSPGLTIGRAGGRWLMQGWEDASIDIAGPRMGKTTTRVIPAILEAPGAVIATSNKTDALNATREQRAEHGPVYVFDPQNLTHQLPALYWDPLSYVTDETRAGELADVFAAAVTDRDARSDGFFAPKGQKVVAALLLAAAAAGRTIDQAYSWVVDPRDSEPVRVLRDHGYPLLADSLAGEINSPEKQRGGVYGTAEKSLAFIANRGVLPWCTPGAGRERLDVQRLLDGTGGTLYSLSREGQGSAAALTAALTVAVCQAAEDRAKRSPDGRLPVPLVAAALDEACNVVRWRALPDLFSHYGSRGIVLAVYCQSWWQLVDAFGQHGARKMWSAATVKVVGAGVSETAFCQDVSRLIGDVDEPMTTVSRSRQGRSTTTGVRRRPILDAAGVAALPEGRAVVFAAGERPAMAEMVPYWRRRELG